MAVENSTISALYSAFFHDMGKNPQHSPLNPPVVCVRLDVENRHD